MKVTIWGINYAPEPTGIGPYNKELCEFFAKRGHSVRMVTSFPYYPAWRKNRGDSHRLYRSETLAGVSIFRCWHFVPKHPKAWKRILHEASFVTTSFFRLLFLPRPDLLLVVSPPLLLGPAAWLIGLLKRTPFHFHIQDMQPDAALALGLIKPGLFSKILHQMEAFTLNRAGSISGITAGMLRLFTEKGVPPEKQYLLPNWIITAQSKTDGSLTKGGFRKKFQIDSEKFLVLYSGNLGKKQGLDIILDAAKIVANTNSADRFAFIIAGEGAATSGLRHRIETESIPVRLIPLQPREMFEIMLQDSDLCMVTQQTGSGSLFFPSKLITLLAAARPVITVADPESELGQSVTEGGFGENIPPNKPEQLASTLIKLSENRQRLLKYSEAGPKWISRFSRNEVLNPFADWFEENLRPGPDPGLRMIPAATKPAAPAGKSMHKN